MNYALIESEIVTKLAPFQSIGIDVVVMPELEADRVKPLPTKAKLTVIYSGSDYPSMNSTAQINQDEKIYIIVLIESTFLRGTFGVYNLIPLIRSALVGFRPTGCGTRMKIEKNHTVGAPEAIKLNNMWEYQIVFSTTSVVVEDFTEDLSVLLKKITLNDGNETLDIPIPDTE